MKTSMRTYSPQYESFDLKAMSVRDRYLWMIGSVIPRPIALVTTVDSGGVVNCAPFSYYNAVSTEPPVVMIAISKRPNLSPKDTLSNIQTTGDFVVNFSTYEMRGALNQSSFDYPPGVSEVGPSGFSLLPSLTVRPPRIAESPLHLECKLLREVELGQTGPGSTTVVFGEVVRLHVHSEVRFEAVEGLIPPGVDPAKVDPLTRLGGLQFGHGVQTFDLMRPKAP